MPFLTTVAVAVAVMGMLNALHRFFLPALSPAMFNVVTILGAFLLVPLMEPIGLPPIAGIAIATVLGGVGQIAIQWPAFKKEGFRYQPILNFRDPGVLEILRLMGPATLGLAAVQINVLVNTSLATTEPQGAVTWLQVAFRLMYLPIGLFGVSVATAALPDLSKHAAADDRDAMRRTISTGLRMMLMLNVPATIGLVVLAQPIVELLLEYDRFTAHDTASTAAALMFYAPGLRGLLRGQDRLPELLLARQQPDTRDRQRGERRGESRAQHHARPCDGIPWAGARNGDRRDLQRQHAARPVEPASRRPRRATRCSSRSRRSSSPRR